jgi:hypothetical protein
MYLSSHFINSVSIKKNLFSVDSNVLVYTETNGYMFRHKTTILCEDIDVTLTERPWVHSVSFSPYAHLLQETFKYHFLINYTT